MVDISREKELHFSLCSFAFEIALSGALSAPQQLFLLTNNSLYA